MELEGLSFTEAAQQLAEKGDIPLNMRYILMKKIIKSLAIK